MGSNTKPGTFTVTADVSSEGYEPVYGSNTFDVKKGPTKNGGGTNGAGTNDDGFATWIGLVLSNYSSWYRRLLGET